MHFEIKKTTIIIIIIKHLQIIFILFSEDMDRKRNKWSLAQMEKAVSDVQNGKKIRKAARENNVPYMFESKSRWQ